MPEPQFVFVEGAYVLRGGDEDPEIRPDASFDLASKLVVLIEHILNRGYDTIINRSANRPVRHETLERLALVVAFDDTPLHGVEVDAIDDLEAVFAAQGLLQQIAALL
jgi:hypothetical protein